MSEERKLKIIHMEMYIECITQLSVMERACARLWDDNRYKLRIHTMMFNFVHIDMYPYENKCICTKLFVCVCDMRVSALQLVRFFILPLYYYNLIMHRWCIHFFCLFRLWFVYFAVLDVYFFSAFCSECSFFGCHFLRFVSVTYKL